MRESNIIAGMSRGGPYSHAVKSESNIYISGQTGLNSSKRTDFASQFNSSIENISMILRAYGKTASEISKLTVFLKRKDDFTEMNALFAKHFPANPPARTTIVCSFVNDDVLVELDAIV